MQTWPLYKDTEVLLKAESGPQTPARFLSVLLPAGLFTLLLSPSLRNQRSPLPLFFISKTWQLTGPRSNFLSLPGPHFWQKYTNWSNSGQLPRHSLLTSVVPGGHCWHGGVGLKSESCQEGVKIRKKVRNVHCNGAVLGLKETAVQKGKQTHQPWALV